jgi:hypothetical protein
VGTSILSVLNYQIYGTRILRSVAEEHEGVAHIKKAQMLLAQFSQHASDMSLVDDAGKEFEQARSTFTRLEAHVHDFPAISKQIPLLNARLYAGKHLVPMSIWMSKAGIEACESAKTLMTRFNAPLKAEGSSITQGDLDYIGTRVRTIRHYVEEALKEANQLTAADVSYDARTSAMFDSFQKMVPMMYSWLTDIENAMPVLPDLLGVKVPANYLLELLDPAELRPGGGVIGNYGFATFMGGKMTAMRIIDVNLLDRAFVEPGKRLSYPNTYQWFEQFDGRRSWSLRDANLDADFPTAARYAQLNYARGGGNLVVQGVIAVTPALIQRLLSLSGAGQSAFKSALSAFASRASPLSEGPGDGIGTILSGYALAPLAKAMMEMGWQRQQAQQARGNVSLSQVVQVLLEALHSKDLQIYFNSAVAEQVLEHHQLSSSVGPGLLVVDTNVGSNRANSAITSSYTDHIELDGNGNASHTTSLNYAWASTIILESMVYHDYVQLYLPPGSVVQAQSGWIEHGTLNTPQHRIMRGEFTLQKSTIPHVVTLHWIEPGVARRIEGGWRYDYTLQRQAGTQWQVDVQIKPPACAKSVKTGGGLHYDSGQSATLTQPLDQDLALTVIYSC